MSAKKEQLEKLVEEELRDEDFQLYWLEWGKQGPEWTLRIYVDTEGEQAGGVTMDQCAQISRKLSPKLEESNLLHRAYNLEVSSPGLERPLKEPRHFRAALDERVVIKTYRPIDETRYHEGVLTKYIGQPEGHSLILEEDGVSRTIALEDVADAKTKPQSLHNFARALFPHCGYVQIQPKRCYHSL